MSATTDGRSLGEVTGDIEKATARIQLPPGYDFVHGGDAEELKDMFRNMFQSLALAVIGGLITSTLLTLVVVPVVYTFFDDLRPATVKVWFTRLFRAGARAKTIASIDEIVEPAER